MKSAIWKVSCLSLALILGREAQAQQETFLKGYIIKGTDTVRGYIAPGKNAWNIKYLPFKLTARSKEIQTFPAGDISSFYLEPTDEWYYRYAVEVERTPLTLGFKETVPKPRMVPDTVFLKKLVGGTLTLYSYVDSDDHFFVEHDGRFEELLYIPYQPYGAKLKVPLKYEGYKNRLDSLTLDCPTPSVSSALYRERPIANKVIRYNTCKSNLTYVHTKGKPYLHLSFLVGISSASANYTGATNTYPITALYAVSKADFSTGTSTLYGASVDFSRRQLAKVKFNLELIYHSQAQFTASNNETNPNKIRRDYFIELGYTALYLGFKTKIFQLGQVEGSFQGNYLFTLSKDLSAYELQNMTSPSPLRLDMANFSSGGSGFVGALRFHYRRFSAQVRWETISFQANEASSITQTAWSALAGIRL